MVTFAGRLRTSCCARNAEKQLLQLTSDVFVAVLRCFGKFLREDDGITDITR